MHYVAGEGMKIWDNEEQKAAGEGGNSRIEQSILRAEAGRSDYSRRRSWIELHGEGRELNKAGEATKLWTQGIWTQQKFEQGWGKTTE